MSAQRGAPLRAMITRPAHQGGALRERLEEHGVVVEHFPTIEIVDRVGDAGNLDKARGIGRYDMLVFISRNAVEYGVRLLGVAGVRRTRIPPSAAIGRSTAGRLTELGFQVVACPAHPSSEGLLETGAVRALAGGARVLIFRGRGGKEVLATKLRARGLEVEYAEVYGRIAPPGRSLEFGDAPPDVILVGSLDSLENLYAMTAEDSRGRLLQAVVVLGSAGMAGRHAELGFTRPPVVADSPLDDDMVRATVIYMGAVETREDDGR